MGCHFAEGQPVCCGRGGKDQQFDAVLVEKTQESIQGHFRIAEGGALLQERQGCSFNQEEGPLALLDQPFALTAESVAVGGERVLRNLPERSLSLNDYTILEPLQQIVAGWQGARLDEEADGPPPLSLGGCIGVEDDKVVRKPEGSLLPLVDQDCILRLQLLSSLGRG